MITVSCFVYPILKQLTIRYAMIQNKLNFKQRMAPVKGKVLFKKTVQPRRWIFFRTAAQPARVPWI